MLDFNQIISTTSQYNFHGHTQYCDGHANMEDFVIEAIVEGFAHFGFSPHAPINIESPCNMSREDVPIYLEEIQRLKSVYGDQISLYAGMEIDYVDVFGPNDDYFQSLPLDYRIGSVHFIPSIHDDGIMVDIDGRFSKFKSKMGKYFDDDIEWVVRAYYNQMIKMVQRGGFDIVGHFDKIGLNASMFCHGLDEEPWYDKLVFQLFEAIMDYNYIVEINTKSWLEHNRFFPHLKYFGMLKKYGAPVVFSSDAHYPTLISSGRDEAMRLYHLT